MQESSVLLRAIRRAQVHRLREDDRLVAVDEDPVLDVPGDSTGQHRAFGLPPDPAQVVTRVPVTVMSMVGIFAGHISA